jgi:hypothetical protein
MSVDKIDATHYRGSDRPCRTTAYRLQSPAATGSNAVVPVAPLIVFRTTQPAGRNALRGRVKPTSLAGETVSVSRKRSDGTWKRVATATVRSDGTWRAEFHVVNGLYRARINPPDGTGLVPGTSPVLQVS